MVIGDLLVVLERKYRALPQLELWGRLFDICLVDSYGEMVRVLCGISYEDWFTTNGTNPSLSTSVELTTAANTNPSRSTT